MLEILFKELIKFEYINIISKPKFIGWGNIWINLLEILKIGINPNKIY